MAVGLLWLSAGCMVGPKYKRPETMADRVDRYANAPQKTLDANGVEKPDLWWERFGDPTTAELVKRALEQNYDLKASAARVLQAQAVLGQASGQRWPSISYGLTGDRSKRFFNFGGAGNAPQSPVLPPPFDQLDLSFLSGGFSPLTTTWSQSVSATYIVDLFGRLRRTQRAAWADLLAADTSRQALINSVIASVIQARVNIATLQRRIEIAQANIKSWERTLEITERRYEQGIISPVDVRLARANLEAARAQEPFVQQSLATAVHALDVLLAEPPGASSSLPQTLPELPQLEPVPIGVPAALLDRRPDVKAAELQLVAANERVGVSIAQLYPDLSLTASYGLSGTAWRDIWSHSMESEIYGGIMNLSAPIFQGGALRAQVRAARARFEELAAQYAGTALTAMREVEDGLVSERLFQEQLGHVVLRVREAQAGEQLAQQRYELGVESILTVLESQRQRRIAEEQLAILKGQIWITRVNLHLAIGGDWNRGESSEEQVAAE
jgi:NodT family efflux transporter outer membrane factor (OMF) lipoprotein